MLAFSIQTVRDIGMVLMNLPQKTLPTEGATPVSNSLVDMSNVWTYGVVVIVLSSLLAWVRNLEHFRFVFLFANILLMATLIMISFYATGELMQNGVSDTIVAINTHNNAYLQFIGYSIYTFEGIGILMPCMQACECPEHFDKILIAAVATLTTIYCLYGTLCYAAWGALQKQMVS